VSAVLPAQALYALRFALELVLGFVLYPLLWLLVALFPWVPTDPTVESIALCVAYGPLAWSALAFLGVPGGGLERWSVGARKPSARERPRIEEALALLSQPVAAPRAVYALDAPTSGAFVIGRAVYLERELIRDPALPAVLAHELAHANGPDGQITLALSRFRLIAPRLTDALLLAETDNRGVALVSVLLGLALKLTAGGLSVWLTRPLWAAYWRRREFAADASAAGLGQGPALADYLERHLLLDFAAPFMDGREHPYTELRIDRLLRVGEAAPLHEAA
jgi:Zn-dependent protease with chaperone function